MANLNAHYSNSQWLSDMGAALEGITADQMLLTLDVAGRRFRLDAAALLHVEHLGQLAEYLQGQETATGMSRIITVAERVREIYDLAFPRGDAGEPEGADEEKGVQPLQ